MNLPPIGLCLPCKYRSLTRADVIEVMLDCEKRLLVRLIDCTSPSPFGETRATGKAAVEFARQVIDEADGEMYVHVPDASQVVLLFCARRETVSVVRGLLYLSTEETLGEILIHAGHATPRN